MEPAVILPELLGPAVHQVVAGRQLVIGTTKDGRFLFAMKEALPDGSLAIVVKAPSDLRLNGGEDLVRQSLERVGGSNFYRIEWTDVMQPAGLDALHGLTTRQLDALRALLEELDRKRKQELFDKKSDREATVKWSRVPPNYTSVKMAGMLGAVVGALVASFFDARSSWVVVVLGALFGTLSVALATKNIRENPRMARIESETQHESGTGAR